MFTPKGEVVNLAAGSCPIDFAYTIHSAVGNKMTGAKVNGKIVPIDYKLQNGEIVEIITSAQSHGPSSDWLKIVKTSQARNKINQWFKRDKREENIEKGKEIIEREVKKYDIKDPQGFKAEFIESVYKKYSFKTMDDMYSSLGYGGITSSRIITRLKDELKRVFDQEHENDPVLPKTTEKKKSSKAARGIVVKGIENCMIRMSKCCNPVPGDEIIGYITRGRGISVHTKDCPNVIHQNVDEEERLIEVSWEEAGNVTYSADLEIIADDRNGLLLEVTKELMDLKISVNAINGRIRKDKKVVIDLTIEINSTEQLGFVVKKLKKIPQVFEVIRIKH